MFSLQSQTLSEPPSDLTQEPLIWKNWRHEHEEFNRGYETKITYDGDKILILGGDKADDSQKSLNLILMDPENQTFKVIPSVGDVESCSWGDVSACYWKDSTVVVFGGYDYSKEVFPSAVAIVTLKDLDSENPSAHWEKKVTPTELLRSGSSTSIYKDKMYVFGGYGQDESKTDIWCLDLTEFTWSQCRFKDHSPGKEEIGAKIVFHENKVYTIRKEYEADVEIMREFDLETMTYKFSTIPKSPADRALLFEPCPQVINGKIYFLENYNKRPKDSLPIRQVLAFDLESRSWTDIKTDSFPSLDKIGSVLSCNNHLILHTIFEKDIYNDGEFWSLPLNPPKPSKYSSTSATVNKIQQTMKEFFFEAPYSDVSFEVESQIIPAHKWLLSQRNKFFANMFSSGISEENPSKITINDFEASTFRALLEYLYSDHVEIDDTMALELLQQANKYFISGELQTACEKHLVKNIETENYVVFGKLAEAVGASSLREAVVAFIARNMKKIKPRKDFNDLSDALLRDSIVKFIVK